MSALVKCLMQTTHSDWFPSWGQAGEGETGSWEEVEGAARWSGLRLMCSFRASMEASLTRAERSAPLRGERERERERERGGERETHWTHTHTILSGVW